MFELPEPGDRPSFFAFAFHKSGSTLMNNMLREAMEGTDIPVVDLYGEAFRNGVQTSLMDASAGQALKSHGYAYLGLRHFFPFETDFDFAPLKKILLVRDPRDMTVSMYFSQKQSHAVPKDDEKFTGLRERMKDRTMEEYLAKEKTVRHYAMRSKAYADHCPRQNLRVYRYEDVIFRKYEWLKDMLAFLEIKVDDERIRAIANENDIRPDDEQPSEHIRQVTPGNHAKHLTEAMVGDLNEQLGPMLRRFGYLPMESNPGLVWDRGLSCFPEPVFNVTYPRSGNTLLIRILAKYFGRPEFNPLPMREFGNFFQAATERSSSAVGDVWKHVAQEGFNWVKHHDFGLIEGESPGLPRAESFESLPVDLDRKYLIQYRHPLDSAVSFYEHQLSESRVRFKDTRETWDAFCAGAIGYWERFNRTWTLNGDLRNRKIVQYEVFVEDLFGVVSEIIQFATGHSYVDEAKLRKVIEPMTQHSPRDIREFRYFDEAFFKEQEARVLSLFEDLNLTPLFN
jgi:hypothetical protein